MSAVGTPTVTSRPGVGGDPFAAHAGVRVEAADGDAPCGLALASLDPAPWAPAAGPVPTGAVLVLVDAAARAAAVAALTGPDRPAGPAALVATATSVQHHRSAAGPLVAAASVPCDGVLADRARDDGTVRFSVAVEVTDGEGQRVAVGSVQWAARV